MKQNSLPEITAKRHTLTIETDEGYLVTGIPWRGREGDCIPLRVAHQIAVAKVMRCLVGRFGKGKLPALARDLGATETIRKPIDTDILLDIIERALEQSQS